MQKRLARRLKRAEDFAWGRKVAIWLLVALIVFFLGCAEVFGWLTQERANLYAGFTAVIAGLYVAWVRIFYVLRKADLEAEHRAAVE